MFKIAKMRTAKERPVEYYEITGGETVELGEALVLASGKLTKATTTPEFIAQARGVGEVIPVVRVMEDDEYESEFSADATSVNVGEKVTLATDGLRVTATTASGVFEITNKIGDGSVGTKVIGLFRR